MVKSIVLLGSTGSIGTQALDVCRKHGITVTALAAYRNVDKIEEQIREFRPKIAALRNEDAAKQLRCKVADLPVTIVSGEEGVLQCAREPADMVLNALVGIAGLKPTLAALEQGRPIALANKETLVAGGALVSALAKEKNSTILPVDSEHSAVFQCLQARPANGAVERIILTASGGPFFGRTKAELAQITPQQALKHPNWSMGAKITVDSATMMNKGLEVIEASWLFDMPEDRIDVLVHRESVIHSMVEFDDYSVLAQLGAPDMRTPIQYALTWPERFPSPSRRLHLTDYAGLTFFKPDEETFSGISLCREALRRGGLCAAALNGANEAAVELFLNGKLSFLQITELAAQAMDRQAPGSSPNLEEILQADRAAREFVRAAV